MFRVVKHARAARQVPTKIREAKPPAYPVKWEHLQKRVVDLLAKFAFLASIKNQSRSPHVTCAHEATFSQKLGVVHARCVQQATIRIGRQHSPAARVILECFKTKREVIFAKVASAVSREMSKKKKTVLNVQNALLENILVPTVGLNVLYATPGERQMLVQALVGPVEQANIMMPLGINVGSVTEENFLARKVQPPALGASLVISQKTKQVQHVLSVRLGSFQKQNFQSDAKTVLLVTMQELLQCRATLAHRVSHSRPHAGPTVSSV